MLLQSATPNGFVIVRTALRPLLRSSDVAKQGVRVTWAAKLRAARTYTLVMTASLFVLNADVMNDCVRLDGW